MYSKSLQLVKQWQKCFLTGFSGHLKKNAVHIALVRNLGLQVDYSSCFSDIRAFFFVSNDKIVNM